MLDGDSLALDTGLRVWLAEVEAPTAGYGDRKDEPGAAVARAIMERASVGREARLWYGGLSRDRYQRAIAHVIAKDEVGADVWLNGVAARQGAARVRTYPDNAKRARKLLVETRRPIKEIAFLCGFREPRGLIRACHRWLGVVPGKLREKSRSGG